jgi:hypothetical protein
MWGVSETQKSGVMTRTWLSAMGTPDLSGTELGAQEIVVCVSGELTGRIHM